MSKIILLNSPQGTGKTELVKYLNSQGMNLVSRECKSLLHKLTMQFFMLDEGKYYSIYESRELKNKPLLEFRASISENEYLSLSEKLRSNLKIDPKCWSGEGLGWGLGWATVELSVRQAMIYISECICKPRFGKDFFGKARAKAIQIGEIAIDDSCGFQEELPPTIDVLGQENILLLRIHRAGHTFEGDSRDWIPDGIINNTVDIYNNGSIEDFFRAAESTIKEFLNG